MKQVKRFLSILLITAMLSGLFPAGAIDLSAPERDTKGYDFIHINPEYAHLPLDLPDPPKDVLRPYGNGASFDSFDAAAVYLREQMAARVETITLTIENYDYADSAQVNADWIALMDSACAHTGDPKYGDYLNRHYGGAGGSFSYYDGDLTLTYEVAYYTTAAQEAEMDTAVTDLLTTWNIEYNIYQLSDYEKVCIIYDYICANVTYDYENREDYLKYTAYAALINRTAVCQGYSSLFYRLALTLGVDARYIRGSSNGGSHGWNIVGLDGYYYQLDATWDAGNTLYSYFLRGENSNFQSGYMSGGSVSNNHTPDEAYLTEEFTAQYPLAAENYEHPQDSVVLSGECGENIDWTIDRNGLLTLSGSGAMTSYGSSSEIPWDDGKGAITGANIGEGITSLSFAAFYGCTSLKEVTLPASLTSIGNYVFHVCDALETIYFGGTEEQWNAIEIGDYNDPLLTAEIICLGGIATGSCGTSVNWVLTDDGVLTISGTGIMSGYLGGETPWYSYREQITTIVIEDGVSSIGEAAFLDFINLTSITIPNTIRTIGNGAFDDCTSLTTITLPDGITGIGNSAFQNCTSLTSIAIPDSVTYIYICAFYECAALTTVYYGGTEEKWSEIFIDEYGNDYLLSAQIIFLDEDDDPTVEVIASGTCDDNLTWTLTDDGVLTISGAGEMAFTSTPWENYRDQITSVVIEDGVTTIGVYAFQSCSKLTSVTIPDSVTTIGIGAFEGCTSLTSVTIPDSVTTIGSGAFRGCTSLTSVTIPGSVTEISRGTFYGCTSLTSVTIPDSVTTIGKYAFSCCSGLTSVTIPDSVTTIGGFAFYCCCILTTVTIPDSVTTIDSYAFSECTSLTSITIPNSVTTIGEYAFYWCTSLTTVTIPDSVTTIGDSAFCGCSGLTSVTIPDSVTTIGSDAFELCTNLTSVTIPNSVTTIGWGMFYGCTSLTSVTIPDSVTTIGHEAFDGCTSLTSVTIPDSVTTIGDRAFSGCTNLTTVYYGGTEEQWNNISINSDNDPLYSAEIIFLGGSSTPGNVIDSGTCGAYGDQLSWTLKSDGTLTIDGDGEMENYSLNTAPWCNYCDTITKIVISGNVMNIGDYAFYNCFNLLDVVISDSVTSVGNNAFDYCDSLTSLTIPDGVTRIGWISNCAALTSIVIPDSVTQIGGFSNCTSLTSIVIPDSVTSMEMSTFSGCTSLTSVTLPAGMTYVSWYMFSGCTSLTNIEFGDQVQSINGNAFYGCTSLAEITLPDSVTYIGESAFEGCTNLVTIIIPDGVTFVGKSAFKNCSSLTSITLPDGVVSIEEAAFNNCNSLETIDLSGVQTIGAHALRNCESLTSVTLSTDLTSVGDYAFKGCDALETVHFLGTEAQWNEISIGSNNDPLLAAQIICLGAPVIIASGTCGENLTWTLDENGLLTISGEGAMEDFTNGGIPWFDYNEQILTVMIEDGATTISTSAFNNCTALTDITLPDGLASIDSHAFSGCTALTNIIIPESVTTIGKYALSSCSSLTSITLPENLTSIEEGVFYECTALASITIPENVTSIGNAAFFHCIALTTITIPENVTNIGAHPFQSCINLAEIIVSDNNGHFSSVDGVLFSENLTTLICYPIGKSDTTYVIPDSVTIISERAFCGCTALTNITIPENVTSIGEYAFAKCSNLTDINIPASVASIGTDAFYHCTGLTEIVVSDNNNNFCSVDGVLFDKNLATLICYPAGKSDATYTIPDSVTIIDRYAFDTCSNLTDITISESVTTIRYRAFSDCYRLTTITISDSVTSIGNYAFYNCYNLETVYFLGTESEWNAIEIGYYNSSLLNAEKIFLTPLPGDINGDEDVTTRDVIILLDAIAARATGEWSDDQRTSADVNGDGRISSRDALIILDAIAAGTTGDL